MVIANEPEPEQFEFGEPSSYREQDPHGQAYQAHIYLAFFIIIHLHSCKSALILTCFLTSHPACFHCALPGQRLFIRLGHGTSTHLGRCFCSSLASSAVDGFSNPPRWVLYLWACCWTKGVARGAARRVKVRFH